MAVALLDQVQQTIKDIRGNSLLDDESSLSILVGYSGGMDSQVLLHIFSRLRKKMPGLTVRAIHINHGLSPNADQWQSHCQRCCDELGIALISEKVKVIKQKGGIEEAARIVRHDIYSRHQQQHEVLALAHHQGDQAETVLYRLMRGAGVKGLSGMALARGSIFGRESVAPGVNNIMRPLLFSPKVQITRYAKDNGLVWVEDESNDDVYFSRNFLRHRVIPEMETHWPHAVSSIARASRHCQEAEELCGALAKQDSLICLGEQSRIVVEKLSQLSSVRQRNLLRYWIHRQGLPTPSEAVMGNIQVELLSSNINAQPLVSWAGAEARRFRGELYFMKSLPTMAEQSPVPWDAISPIRWKPLEKTIRVRKTSLELNKRFKGQSLSLRVRVGGERCRPAGRVGGSQKLKKLFQEYKVEPWLRDRWPILFCGDELVALPGLFVCEQVSDEMGDPTNLRFFLDE